MAAKVANGIGSGLLERDVELGALRDLVRAALRGNSGVVVVEGPPGIGKSGLVAAAVGLGAEHGLRVLAGGGSELEQGFAFGVVRQLFEPLVSSLSGVERASVFTGAGALALPLFGASEIPPGSPGDIFPLLHGLYWTVVGLSAAAPLLIAVDDVHWVDEPSLRWLHYLARRVEGLPVAVVLACRSTEPEAPVLLLEALKADPDVTVLRPEPLSEAAAHVVLGEIFSEEPAPEFTRVSHEASGGNPFLLRELGRALAVEGSRPTSSAIAGVREARPEAIARRVLVRLGHLPLDARTLARAVAVFGGGVGLRYAAELAGLDDDVAAGAADTLGASGLLAVEPPLRFTHDLVRAAVYGDVGGSQRGVLHRRAASILIDGGESAERVAAQLLLSEPDADPVAVEWLQAAAASAAGKGSLATACAYLRRALAEPPGSDARPRVLLELAGAEAAAADPNAASRLPEAFECATDGPMRADAFEGAAWFLLASGRTAETLAMLDKVRDELSASDPSRELELEAQFIAAALLDPAATGVAADRLTRLGSRLRDSSCGERMVLCQSAYLRTWRGEDAVIAVELAERALAGGALLDERGVQPHELTGPIMAFVCADRLDDAASVIADAQAIALARGSEHLFAFLSCMRAGLAYRAGALAEAEAEASTSVEITVRSGLLLGAAVAAGWLITTLVDRGELDRADDALGAVSGSGEIAPLGPFNILLAARGRLRLARGQLDAGMDDLLECGKRNRGFEIRNPVFVPWRADAIAGHRLRDELEAARALAREELAAAEAWGTPGALGSAHRVSALVASSNDEAIKQLRQAEALLRRSPAKLELAQALVELGAALRRDRRRQEAREPLAEGRELAARCHAGPLAERARIELLAAGARPRRVERSGVESLTASEHRVAKLAASGMTNREIAQQLFVTVRTVDGHLRHVYSKLDIHGRDQLADALTADA